MRHAAVLGHVSDRETRLSTTSTSGNAPAKKPAATRAATEMRASRGAVARATNAPESACVKVSIAGSCSCRQKNQGQSGQSTFSLVTGPTFLSSRQDANAKKVLYFLGAPFDVAQDMLCAFARVTFSFLSIFGCGLAALGPSWSKSFKKFITTKSTKATKCRKRSNPKIYQRNDLRSSRLSHDLGAGAT